MNLGPFDQPLWLVALLAIPPLLVVTSYRVGWLATLLVFLRADSSMLFAEEPRQPRVRVAVLGLLLLQGLLRLRGRGRAEMPPRPALLPSRWRRSPSCGPRRAWTSVRPHCSMTISTRSRERARLRPFSRARNLGYSRTRMSGCSGLFSGINPIRRRTS